MSLVGQDGIGLRRIGLDWIGLDWVRLDWVELDSLKCGLDWIGSLRGVRVAIGPRKHVTSKGPGRTRTEKTCHFEGYRSQLDRGNTSLRRDPGRISYKENTSLRIVRVAIGPRKHVTSRGPGRNWTEKTHHFEGSGSQSDRENTSHRGVRVAIGPRKHVTSRGPGRNWTDRTRHFE